MRVIVALLCLALVGSAAAEPFWIEYDASCGLFPEEVGWTRSTYAGGDQRWFEGGSLVLDGRASIDFADDYYTGHALNLGAGEQFVAEWHMRVDEVEGFADPLVGIDCGAHGTLTLRYTTESVYSLLESVWIPFTPGQFHTYELRSEDLVNYQLYIDTTLAHVGRFVGAVPVSGLTWGDGTVGASSLSVWDYARFGIVPEPCSGLLLGLGCLFLISLVRRATS
jgi:hypothetical protein